MVGFGSLGHRVVVTFGSDERIFCFFGDTVDGRNPPPPEMYKTS